MRRCCCLLCCVLRGGVEIGGKSKDFGEGGLVFYLKKIWIFYYYYFFFFFFFFLSQRERINFGWTFSINPSYCQSILQNPQRECSDKEQNSQRRLKGVESRFEILCFLTLKKTSDGLHLFFSKVCRRVLCLSCFLSSSFPHH